ncbi:MAG: hypothetical protein ACYDDF_04420 [Thermoplasmatota archaeon]
MARTLGDRVSLAFMAMALVWFFVAMIWMGFNFLIPEPSTTDAQSVYNTARTHTATIGWVGFSLLAVFYYMVPRMAGTELRSKGLAWTHFWVTVIAFPVGLVCLTVLSFRLDPVIQRGLSLSAAFNDPSITPLRDPFTLAFVIGLIAQILFAINITRTLRQGPANV